MAYNSISGYSTTRLTGLSSGLDTDSLIKAAMTASQSKLDKMYQSKTKLEWKRDAYTDVRTKVSTFSQKYMSALSPDNIFSKSAYKQFKVSMSDKYDSYFSVKGTSSATSGSHTITKATKATYATLQGTKYRNRTAGLTGGTNTNSKASVTGTTKLYKLKDGVSTSSPNADDLIEISSDDTTLKLNEVYRIDNGVVNKAFESETVTFKVNDQAVSGTTLGDLISGVNSAPSKSRATMSITADGTIKFEGNTFGSKSGIEFDNGVGGSLFGKNGVFGINDTSIKAETQIYGSMKLGDIVAMRDANPQYDSKGNVIPSKLNSGNFKVRINNQDFEFKADETVDDIINKVNSSDANVTMSFENGQFSIRSNVDGNSTWVQTENVEGSFFGGDESFTGIAVDSTSDYQTIDRSTDTLASAAAKMGINFANGKDTISFKINGESFTFSKNITLDKMMSEINANSDAKARITYSQITDSFEITSSETGRATTVTFESDDQDAINLFGLTNPTSEGTFTAHGTDAILEIDGETITRSSNKFVLDGLEITIKDDFVADDFSTDGSNKATVPGLGKATLTVEQDVDGVVEKVKNFVTAYNELVDSLYGMISEEKDYDYDALTEDQRDNMEKEDIEKWEAEAKKGILRNDTTIRSFLSKMRGAIFETIGGVRFSDITEGNASAQKGLSANSIGFSTSTYAAGEYGGKIVFDEEKFRAALERDPEAVANVMAQVSDATDADTEYQESGFITKLYDMMSDFTNTMRGTNIKNVNEQITTANKQMEDQIAKMYEEQERLYQQYAALETLMSQYQSQSTWLTQQFSSLTTTA